MIFNRPADAFEREEQQLRQQQSLNDRIYSQESAKRATETLLSVE